MYARSSAVEVGRLPGRVEIRGEEVPARRQRARRPGQHDAAGIDRLARRQDHGALDHVAQLAHVARVVVRGQQPFGLGRERRDRLAHARREPLQEMRARAAGCPRADRAAAARGCGTRPGGGRGPGESARARPPRPAPCWSPRRRARRPTDRACRPAAGTSSPRGRASSFACVATGISPTSSRNSVPPSASSNSPRFCALASVNAPRSWPNSSLSSRFSGTVAQLISTNAPSRRRGVRRAIRSAISSLPVPDSPWIRTVVSVASATLSTMPITFCIAGDGPATKSPIAACARAPSAGAPARAAAWPPAPCAW